MGNNRVFSALLLTLLVSSGFCKTQCPPQEDMPSGCSCKESSWGPDVNCFGNGESPMTIEEIATQLKEKFPVTNKLGEVKFENFKKPNTLSSAIFKGLCIFWLNIKNSNIVSWSENFGGAAFVGLEDCLEDLIIENSIHSRERYGAPFSLSHLRELKGLTMSGNNLYVFGKDWFGNGGSQMIDLDISDNEIHTIHEEALVGLSKLESLILKKNNVEGFPKGFFDHFTFLEELNLGENPIMSLPENVYKKIWSQLNSFRLINSRLHCDDHINWMLKVREPRTWLVWCETPVRDNLKDILRERRMHYRRL